MKLNPFRRMDRLEPREIAPSPPMPPDDIWAIVYTTAGFPDFGSHMTLQTGREEAESMLKVLTGRGEFGFGGGAPKKILAVFRLIPVGVNLWGWEEWEWIEPADVKVELRRKETP